MPAYAPDPFASTELLKNDFPDADNPFVADPFSDENENDDLERTPAPHAHAPLATTAYQQPLKPPASQPSPINTSPAVTSAVKPGPPSKPFLNNLSTYGKPSDLPDDIVEALNKILGRDINVRELFSRLERTRENSEAWARGERGPVGQSAELHDSKRDLSKHLFHDPAGPSDSSATSGYRDDEGKPKPPSMAKRAAVAFRKALGLSQDSSSISMDSPPMGTQRVTPNAYASGAKTLPAPPQHIHADDHLTLAIFYHEREDLEISAIYLEKSANEGHPLGLYLRALTLRHGWGVPENKELAFRCLLESAESSLMTIPEIADRRKLKAESGPSSPFDTSDPSAKRSSTKTRPADLRSLRSYATVASLLPEDIHTATALLPLPLFEIGMCFRQGWGVLKSYPAAVYYFGIAARLGDPDAMYELGYCYLNHTPGVTLNASEKMSNRQLAAMWLREADKTGKKVIGESWIWKKKWGGEED
ncbi:hypothetical protein HDU67_006444 [Dinochytrium kinnereticum]|nr:hypothetical protein HDU67_006444 [Dinochytrium kinnereticum]